MAKLDKTLSESKGGRIEFKERYQSLMPIKPDGREMTCGELHQKLAGKGLILDKVKQVLPICSALKIGKNMMFAGPPGTAKTLTAKKLSEILNKRDAEGRISPVGFYRISANRDMSASDFFGDWKFHKQMLEAQQCREGGCKNKDFFSEDYFNDGPALKAVKDGGVLFIDEVNRAGPDFPNLLFEVAEEKQVTIPTLNKGEPIRNIDRRFPLVIGTMNEIDTGTTREMSSALARRFAYIYFDNADGDMLQRILDENYGPAIKETGSEVIQKVLSNLGAKNE